MICTDLLWYTVSNKDLLSIQLSCYILFSDKVTINGILHWGLSWIGLCNSSKQKDYFSSCANMIISHLCLRQAGSVRLAGSAFVKCVTFAGLPPYLLLTTGCFCCSPQVTWSHLQPPPPPTQHAFLVSASFCFDLNNFLWKTSLMFRVKVNHLPSHRGSQELANG